MNTLQKIAVLLAVAFVSAFGFYVLCLNHVSVNEVGIEYNSVNGQLSVQTNNTGHAGWYVTSPMVKVTCLSMLPEVVHVPSAAKVINTKIVRLNPDAILDFIKLQGFSYQLGQSQNNILMGYAFSGQKFTFLEIVQEGGLENAPKANQ